MLLSLVNVMTFYLLGASNIILGKGGRHMGLFIENHSVTNCYKPVQNGMSFECCAHD